MGHIVNPDREYRLLQRRLDRHLTGAPDSPTFMKVLKILFTPEDAELVRQLPGRLTPLHVLSRKLGIRGDELGDKMTELAQRGLVVDLEHNGQRYFTLSPVILGFLEFTFMRIRDDLPMTELARLIEECAFEDDRFLHSAFQGQTQVGRSLVREEALPNTDHTEILDWERASHIVRSASAIGVSLCTCRHMADHLGRACDRLLKSCLSFNYAAEMVIRNGMAEAIDKDEALRILQESKEAGLAQTGDNVQRKVTYICNCCGCCCGMIQAIKRFDVRNAIVTSNWIMEVDLSECKGCGKCVEACPVGAIELVEKEDRQTRRKWAACDQTLCLGCGVCHSSCKFGAISMKSRQQRVYTPETAFDRYVSMAIERGKLSDLIFDDPQRLSHRALWRIFKLLEKSPPYKVLMAIRPLRSAFLKRAVERSRKEMGDLAGLFE